MKAYCIYYTNPGVTYKKTPCQIVKASSADAAIEAFRSANKWYNVVAIFKA